MLIYGKEATMKKEKKLNTDYHDARKKWARGHAELFLNALERLGRKTGTTLTPMQYVKAYNICVEDLMFGFPAEFKIAELISPDETDELTLEILTELMKRFRLDFYRTRKKQLECKMKQNARRKKRVA